MHLGSGSTSTPLRIEGTSAANIPNVVVDSIVVGTIDPSTVAPNAANASTLISGQYAPSIVVRDSYLTEAGSVFLDFNFSPSPTITGTEMGGAGTDGFNAQATSAGMTVSGNRFFGANDFCVDGFNAGLVVEDNTFLNCGDFAGQSGGVRIGDFTGTIRRNVFQNNNGPGIVVAGENTAQGRIAGRAVISRNHFFDNAGLAIDNHVATTDNFINGDGITLNDGGVTADAGNAFLDFPVITAVAPGGPGTVDVTGTACGGCVVEIFSALPGSGETEPAVPLPHGEGAAFLASGTANGAGAFTINIPSAGVTEITATATDTGLGATSEFSQNSGLQLISGRVLIDLNGDADMSDATPAPGATVRVYRDLASNAPGLETPDAGDPLLETLTTDATGRWTFANAIAGNFWITVDSRTVAPAALNGGFVGTDVWSDQTFGPAGSLRANGSGGVELTSADGPVVGGRTGTGSDTASSIVTSEHVFRTDASAPRLDLDTGFSFNVVTNLQGGDGTDLAPEGTRTVQGTMRQFLQNANAVAGPNTMRFVPAVPTNASGGGHTWWQLSLTAGLPPITDADTTVDGNARQWNSPVNGIDGTATPILPDPGVGANTQAIGTVDLPELLLWGNRATEPTMDGIRVQAPTAVVQNVAMLGFDDGVEVGTGGADTTSSVTITTTALGLDIATQGDPGSSNRLNQGVRVLGGQQATVQQNVIGFTKQSGVRIEATQPAFLIDRNQLLQTGLEAAPSTADGITIQAGGSGTISLNHISGSRGGGVDLVQTGSAITINDNTIDGFGAGGIEQFGVRVYGTGSTVQDNSILNGVGSAVAVVGDNGVPTPGRPASQVTISGNAFGALGGGISGAATIDLIGPATADLPDGPTPNDGVGCGPTPGYGNQGLDSPAIAVEVIGASWHLTGTGCPNSSIELYEGDLGTGLAITRIFQTVVQPDGTIDNTFPALAATHVTASQTNGTGSTSEFGPVVAVTGALPPVLTNPGPQTATESIPYTLAPVGTDPDSSPVTWSASGMPPAMTIDPSTGALAWTPSETDGGSSFSITLSLTGGGVTVSETFVLSVVEDDQPPLVAAIPDGSATVGLATVQPVTGSDPDLPAVALTWSLQGPVPPGMSIDPSTGTITFVPTVAGPVTVQVVATQPNLLSGSSTWTVTASDVAMNAPPTVSPVPNQTVVIDDGIVIPIAASDPDGPLSYAVLVGPAGMTVDASGQVRWNDAGPQGTQSVTIRVSDSGSPAMATDVSFTIQVTLPPTTAPPVTGGGTTTIPETTSTSSSTPPPPS
ncbi:MAG: right-handed parallel beta-helix repeat-containing protein, partial [Acidimicrobiales bacterium]